MAGGMRQLQPLCRFVAVPQELRFRQFFLVENVSQQSIGFANQLYDLRLHIDMVRRRLSQAAA